MADQRAIRVARQSFGRQLAGLRCAANLTQYEFASLVGFSRSTVANIEVGRQQPSPFFCRKVDEVLATGGALRAALDDVEQLQRETHCIAAATAGDQRRRQIEQWRHAMTSSSASALSMDHVNHQDLESILIDVADQSASFLAWAEASNVGDLTVEQLHTEIRRIALNYLKVPTLPLFERALGLRDRVFSLLGGRQKPAHSRDLYGIAGWSLTVLA